MGKITGFIEFKREAPKRRPVAERVHDWQEVYLPFEADKLQKQGARCMDCGIPFCHQGCPLGNLIPDWNDLVYRDRWREAIDRLHATNNFPEWTGRLCPAPCEGSCVLGINDDPVTIKQVEVGIIEHAFDEGWVTAESPAIRTGKKVAVGGAEWPRDLQIPGRELGGIHFAMDYLTLQNRRCEGDPVPDADFITAEGKHVVIIGGGDTGADCLGTGHRQGARSVTQFEILPRPPAERDVGSNPWPLWPNIFRVSSAHEEGGAREYSINTTHFSGEAGRVTTLHAARVEMVREGGRVGFKDIPGTEHAMEAELVLLAMGFLGPRREGLLTDLGVKLTERGNVWSDASWMTSVPGVFAAGDMQRGQSLIVWAIAEGRSAARGVDLYLMGKSDLPAPLS